MSEDGKSVEQRFIDILYNTMEALPVNYLERWVISFGRCNIVTTSFNLLLATVMGRPMYSVSTTASAEVLKSLRLVWCIEVRGTKL